MHMCQFFYIPTPGSFLLPARSCENIQKHGCDDSCYIAKANFADFAEQQILMNSVFWLLAMCLCLPAKALATAGPCRAVRCRLNSFVNSMNKVSGS